MTKTKIFFVIIFLTGIFLLPKISLAVNYYVATNGTSSCSDQGATAWANAININTPSNWCTSMARAVAGDTVYFRGGSYNLGTFDNQDFSMAGNTRMFPANSGTAGNPITFIAYPGETPDITGTVTATSQEAWFGCGQKQLSHIDTKDYITWDGFSATMQVNASGFETAIFRIAGDNCTIRNSNFTGVDRGYSGNNTTFIRVEEATNAVIENNYFHDLTSTGYDSTNTGAIYGNTISNNIIIRNNTITNCEGGVLSKGNGANWSIYNNFIYSTTGYKGIWKTRSINTTFSTSATVIYQNIIVGYPAGIWLESNNDTITDGTLIYNNTIYTSNNTDDGIYVDHDFNNTEVYNNILVNRNPFLRYDSETSPGGADSVSYSDFNLFNGTQTNAYNCNYGHGQIVYSSLATWNDSGNTCRPIDYDDNSIVSNPLFVNTGGSTPEDYKRTSYPQDGRGGIYPNIMGAYITGDEIIGYVAPVFLPAPDTTPPSAPTGLVVI